MTSFMIRKKQGTYFRGSAAAGERYRTYCPRPLPPPINYSKITESLTAANVAVGELNGVAGLIPDSSIINYVYLRKEAVLSSWIEGTQSTLDDLLKYEAAAAPGVPTGDVEEVSSYVAAMNHGVARLAALPLSLRLIREIHKALMTNARGAGKTPGRFRTTQNWIGGTRPGNAVFVPVGPDKLADALSAFEKFMNAEDKIPELVRAALLHHQFETIHPFLDGNGRVGRLLITLYLTARGFLSSPCLYLSLYFKKHRRLYYDYLNSVREDGNWERWINFFLEGVAETAVGAKDTLLNVREIFGRDEAAVSGFGRSAKATLAVLDAFKKKPMMKIGEVMDKTELTRPTAISSVNRLMEHGILSPLSDRKWGRAYIYADYVNALNEE